MVEKELLQKSSLLRELPPEKLHVIAQACETVSVEAGEYIYKKGTAGEFFFLVLSGEVELIETRDDKSTCMIGRIGEGGHFGESSLLTGQKRSLSIRAVSDVMLGRFSSTFFNDTLLVDPVFHRELDKTLVNRLRFAMREWSKIVST